MHSARKRLERRQAELLISPKSGRAISNVTGLTDWEEQQIRKKLRKASKNLEEYFSVFATERGGHLDFNGFGRAIRCVNSVNSRVTNREIKALWATVFDKRDKGYVRVSKIVKWIKNERNNYVRRKVPVQEQQIQKHRYIVLHDFSSSVENGRNGSDGGAGNVGTGGDSISGASGGNGVGSGSTGDSSASTTESVGETKDAVRMNRATIGGLFQRGQAKGGSVLSSASLEAYTP